MFQFVFLCLHIGYHTRKPQSLHSLALCCVRRSFPLAALPRDFWPLNLILWVPLGVLLCVGLSELGIDPPALRPGPPACRAELPVWPWGTGRLGLGVLLSLSLVRCSSSVHSLRVILSGCGSSLSWRSSTPSMATSSCQWRCYSSIQKEGVSIELSLLKRSLPRRPCLSSSPCSSSSSCPPPHPSRYCHFSLPLSLGMTKVATPTSLVVPARSTTKGAVRDLPSHGQGAHNSESHTCR